eukprot:1988773-Rhodomonas_salina.3
MSFLINSTYCTNGRGPKRASEPCVCVSAVRTQPDLQCTPLSQRNALARAASPQYASTHVRVRIPCKVAGGHRHVRLHPLKRRVQHLVVPLLECRLHRCVTPLPAPRHAIPAKISEYQSKQASVHVVDTA